MIFGKITDLSDLQDQFPDLSFYRPRSGYATDTIKLSGEVYSERTCIFSCNVYSAWWRQQDIRPFPLNIPINQKNKEAQTQYCQKNSLENIYNHHILDDLYHWYTSYRHLPFCPTDEQILARINHPMICWGITTQIMVNRWAINKTKKQVFKLLHSNKQSKWFCRGANASNTNLMYAPSLKWKAFYQHNNNRIYPTIALGQILTTIENRRLQESFLLSYSERATNFFEFKIGTNPAYKTFLGVELELENLTVPDQAILTKTLGKHCIFKRDGSVSSGVEICSAPATLDVHKHEFKSFFENKEKTLEVRENCGMHVHIDRKKLHITQIAKITKFMNHPDNNIFIEKLAGRIANNYCSTGEVSWDAFTQLSNFSRHSRINLTNRDTIELRLFASTLNYQQFVCNLEFCQAIIDYTSTGEHSCSITESIKWNNFTNYITAKHQFYPVLHKYLKGGN